MVSSGWRTWLAAETDVVSEGVLTVVTYNRREAVERTRHGVRRGSRSYGALNRDGRRRRRDGSGWLRGELTGCSVWREVENLWERHSTVVFRSIMAVVH